MKPNPSLVGSRIRRNRKEKGLTMVELGKMINAPQSAISNWEKGDNLPNNERLAKLSTIFNVTVDELLYGSELSPYQVKDMLINNSLKPILDKKIKEFLDDDSKIRSIDIYQTMYLMKLRYFLRESINHPDDSVNKRENIVRIKITETVIDDLYKHKPYLEKGGNPYTFNLVTDLLNDNVNVVYFFDYLTSKYEYTAKHIPICLKYMLGFRLQRLIGDSNYLLSNFISDDETAEFGKRFLTPNLVLDGINFSDYEKLMNKLHDALSFVENSLFPTENNTED